MGLITSGCCCFPHLIRAFLQDHDHVDLDMTVRSRDQLVAMLRCDGSTLERLRGM